jgi:ABC-type branched-subunit amino acid transport system ATPase component
MPTSQDEQAGPLARPDAFLDVDDLSTGYGASLIVQGVSVQVGQGEVVCLLGPNGSGKSTLMKAITGELPVRGGRLTLDGMDVTGKRRDELVRLGLRLVPQEQVVFESLSVRENLEMGGYLLKRREVGGAIETVLETLPALRRLLTSVAGRLSGGERKLVAIGRALMTQPRVVVLDEPSASLSPSASEKLLSEHIPALSGAGVAVLLVEQRAIQALQASHWAYVMVAGRVRLTAAAPDVLARGDIAQLFLGKQADGDTPAIARSGKAR